MPHRDELRRRAQALRREMTREERRLWYDFLRAHPLQFKRQAVFGDYIVDFYCSRAKLVVELDGGQHYQGDGPDYDRRRTAALERAYGLTVLRFTNLEVKENFEGVCQAIELALSHRLPSPVALGAESFPQGTTMGGL